jgi:hypothetical protein
MTRIIAVAGSGTKWLVVSGGIATPANLRGLADGSYSLGIFGPGRRTTANKFSRTKRGTSLCMLRRSRKFAGKGRSNVRFRKSK